MALACWLEEDPKSPHRGKSAARACFARSRRCPHGEGGLQNVTPPEYGPDSWKRESGESRMDTYHIAPLFPQVRGSAANATLMLRRAISGVQGVPL